ncbi:hypothetical protein DPV73_11700 [Leptospira mayottensis]|nr:hypothetical protein DPV73_11700 [Leptospira mayottensis]
MNPSGDWGFFPDFDFHRSLWKLIWAHFIFVILQSFLDTSLTEGNWIGSPGRIQCVDKGNNSLQNSFV